MHLYIYIHTHVHIYVYIPTHTHTSYIMLYSTEGMLSKEGLRLCVILLVMWIIVYTVG